MEAEMFILFGVINCYGKIKSTQMNQSVMEAVGFAQASIWSQKSGWCYCLWSEANDQLYGTDETLSKMEIGHPPK